VVPDELAYCRLNASAHRPLLLWAKTPRRHDTARRESTARQLRRLRGRRTGRRKEGPPPSSDNTREPGLIPLSLNGKGIVDLHLPSFPGAKVPVFRPY